jgi:hypothetical protein
MHFRHHGQQGIDFEQLGLERDGQTIQERGEGGGQPGELGHRHADTGRAAQQPLISDSPSPRLAEHPSIRMRNMDEKTDRQILPP